MTRKSNSNKTGATKPRLTKKAQLIHMLSTQSGADLAVISGKLGWQRHTIRAAIAGLRKAGFAVEAAKPDTEKPTRYRIISTPTADAHANSSEAANAG